MEILAVLFGSVVIAAVFIFLMEVVEKDVKLIVENNMKDEAVKAGHAEYYLDENNVRQWRWKESTRG